MDDRLRETLSAMMDDEADELSVRRLLSHPGQDEVRAQWQRWQNIRDLMHEGQVPPGSVDVSHRVRAVLDNNQRPSPQPVVTASASSRWHWPAAAMVTLAMLVGFGMGAGWESGTDKATATADSSTPTGQSVAEVAAAQATPVPEVALQGLDEEQWEHLSRYLLEHAQHNSVAAGRGSVGYARLVSASGPGYQ